MKFEVETTMWGMYWAPVGKHAADQKMSSTCCTDLVSLP